MNKNTIIGFILIGAVMFGFTWYQSKQYAKQVKYQARLDSIAAVEELARIAADSNAYKNSVTTDSLGKRIDFAAENNKIESGIYKDRLLGAARSKEGKYLLLSNDKVFTILIKGSFV